MKDPSWASWGSLLCSLEPWPRVSFCVLARLGSSQMCVLSSLIFRKFWELCCCQVTVSSSLAVGSRMWGDLCAGLLLLLLSWEASMCKEFWQPSLHFVLTFLFFGFIVGRVLACGRRSFPFPEGQLRAGLVSLGKPWEAFHPDGVIIFSDILTQLPAFGVPFDIEELRDPVTQSPIRSEEGLKALLPIELEKLQFMLVSTVSNKCPKTPLVLYINGNGERMKRTGVDVIGLSGLWIWKMEGSVWGVRSVYRETWTLLTYFHLFFQ
ncbi:hypothetical protein SADUNF_Sadunf11G0075400 [Salix dunnii]|uniref:Uroporphyrinogen decarboxylase (URO-D) domain-containing protein n=1 Tax=Salix dunnii TaxID=1413687 RepID=A0A835JP57_9ROSI|nr:hypothetical protein SADUNF_Sadunf11G0075400 [Salix dunnii]